MTPEERLAETEKQRAALHAAVGQSIAAWATVEIQLSIIFSMATRLNAEVVDAILTPPRSFDVRRSIVHNVMRIRLAGEPLLDDWNLLSNYVREMSAKRNEIAHSTTVSRAGAQFALEPYFVLTKARDQVSVEEVLARAAKFSELTGALGWLCSHLFPPLEPQQAFLLPVPDLLLRLRTEELQRREEQRKQQKP